MVYNYQGGSSYRRYDTCKCIINNFILENIKGTLFNNVPLF